MKKLSKLLMMLLFVWIIWPTNTASASGTTGIQFEKDEKNVIIVMDYSGSMKTQDSTYCVPQVFSTLLQLLKEENICIGFVAYNDSILVKQSLVPLTDEKEIDEMKDLIQSLPYKGETDIGLALKTAYQMLEEKEGIKHIVLLSDGEIDLLATKGGRTKNISDEDVRAVIELCKESNTSISTVAYGEKSNKILLNQMAGDTAGKFYYLDEPGELMVALVDLFFSKLEVSLRNTESSIYGAGRQIVSYEGDGVRTRSILLISEEKIRQIEVEEGETGEVADGEIILIEMGKLKGDFKVSFQTKEQQKVWILELTTERITSQLQWPQGRKRNDSSPFKITFHNQEGMLLLEEELKRLSWTGILVNQLTGEETLVEIEQKGGELSGTVYFDKVGEYLFCLRTMEGIGDYYIYNPISVENTLPKSILEQNIELFSTSGEKRIALEDYIIDSDEDRLSYTLLEVPSTIAKVVIEDSELIIEPLKKGNGKIKLMVSDGEENLVIECLVTVNSFWEIYLPIILITILIIVLLIWRIYSKKESDIPLPIRIEEKSEGSFTGKLNAYFTRIPEGMEEIPVLTFALYAIREKKIALKDMFADYPELVTLLELDKIYFFPSKDREMIVYQECQSAVMIGNALVCRKMQYVINYGNVIYITSKDGKCELEVHYIAMI